MIVPVILRHEGNPGIEVKVYALLDDASDTTFIKSSVKETLGVQGVDTALILSTMLGREEIQVSRQKGSSPVAESLHQGPYSIETRPDT